MPPYSTDMIVRQLAYLYGSGFRFFDAGSGRLLSVNRRSSLVILQSLGPYLADMIIARLERQQRQREEMGLIGFTWDTHDSADQRGSLPDWNHTQHASHMRTVDLTGVGDTRAKSWLQAQRQRFQHIMNTAKQRLASTTDKLLPVLQPTLAYIARLHLALFYLTGLYYSIPHRLSGIRYVSTAAGLHG